MSDANPMALLPALNIAAFERSADGTFSAIAPAPAWFPRLADTTFPFLGHILEEATQFWNSGAGGSREFGPCAEVDESGREFHYRVRALTVPDGGSQFLIFELDPGSDRLRDVLQKAREQMLALEQDRATQSRAAAEVRLAGSEILQLLTQLSASGTNEAQAALINQARAWCEALIATSDRMSS